MLLSELVPALSVFPQCRHVPESPARGRETEKERRETEGDPQGAPHLALAVRVITLAPASWLRPLLAGDAAAGSSVPYSLSSLRKMPRRSPIICLVVFVFLFFGGVSDKDWIES